MTHGQGFACLKKANQYARIDVVLPHYNKIKVLRKPIEVNEKEKPIEANEKEKPIEANKKG